MNNLAKVSVKVLAIAILGWLAAFFPLKTALADQQADKDAYQRKIDSQVQELQQKIDETKMNYREDGSDAGQKIQQYEDRIAEIKRESAEKMNDQNWDKSNTAFSDKISQVRKDFYEWRLERDINGYRVKISDLKAKADQEVSADKKMSLQTKVKKLETKNDAAQAKLQDLKMTNGANWDKIQKDLDYSLREIDLQYKEASRS